MTLYLYNTLTRAKEPFTPQDPKRVTMYVCGPTVYNYIHIGNARPVVVFDVLFRLLKRTVLGGGAPTARVVYARNLTDVDDKIIDAAKANHEPIETLTSRFIDAFHEDIAALNTLAPTIEPRATEHIAPMIQMIEALLERGCAYEAQGHVLFHVPSWPAYGQLSGRRQEDLIAGSRVEVAPYKRDAADFVLWKPSATDQPGWDSPWGHGRPGWHLECSVMVKAHLGETIDIHGGGQDLVFPHHENEIAQSTCAHAGRPLARVWLHNGHLTLQGEKMSKSLGNVFILRDLTQRYPGEVIRYALLSAHYRKPLDWSATVLEQARASLDRLYKAIEEMPPISPDEMIPSKLEEALEDDLNTPQALAYLHELAGQVNSAADQPTAIHARQGLLAAGQALGLLYQDPQAWFQWTPAGEAALNAPAIEARIEARNQARQTRDFARADAIRTELAAHGVLLEDTPAGTRWYRA